MATLSKPTLKIDILTGEPTCRVTATVYVELSAFEKSLINPGSGRAGLPVKLSANLWGDDSGLTGGDDQLFSFPTRKITRAGTYIFSANVPRSVLNEDSSFLNNDDEIYNRFSLVSENNIIPRKLINTPTITGYF